MYSIRPSVICTHSWEKTMNGTPSSTQKVPSSVIMFVGRVEWIANGMNGPAGEPLTRICEPRLTRGSQLSHCSGSSSSVLKVTKR